MAFRGTHYVLGEIALKYHRASDNDDEDGDDDDQWSLAIMMVTMMVNSAQRVGFFKIWLGRVRYRKKYRVAGQVNFFLTFIEG